MSVARVLIIDDSVLVRKAVSASLEKVQGIEVVGTASNGRIGLQRIQQLSPNIVVLDIEMPEMDGLETLKEIRARHPELPVIMFSTLTEHGARITLEALDRGASDYVPKPSGTSALEESVTYIRKELGARILELATPASPSESRIPIVEPAAISFRLPPKRSAPRVVAIGASTGGPHALSEVLRRIPAAFPLPIVITQHMPPLFTKLLAERLTAQVGYTVLEAADDLPLSSGSVLIAPGDLHLTFVAKADGQVYTKLSTAPPENSCRPAVDTMLRSLVGVYGGAILSVILTGMGRDGLVGCELVAKAGGAIITQDEASSVVWGMPGFVSRAGLAEQTLPLADIGGAIVRKAANRSVPLEAHG